MTMHQGRLFSFGVWITDQASIEELYTLGFGKGILSRSKPSFFKSTRHKYADKNKQREAFHAKQISIQIHQQTGNELECLQLSAVESFYIQDTLKNITISQEQTKNSKEDDSSLIMTTEDLWKFWVESIGISFVAEYCAYCQYRTMGWIVRGGLKYGVDFVLYSNGGPSQNHGELTVSVNFVHSLENSASLTVERFSQLTDLQALSRITENVSKGLLLCFVYTNETLGQSSSTIPPEFLHPSIINKMKIKDFVIRRWDPTKVRE